MRNVTIVIDGQAGSCGKGKLCGFLALTDDFEMSTNNWSSNAGHTFVSDNDEKIVVSHLPMALLNKKCKLVLNAGSIITPEILIDEIRKYNKLIGRRKIYIHPRAMIIKEKHRNEEKNNIKSGSTFKGCGASLAEKIMRNSHIELMRDYYDKFPDDIKKKIVITDTAYLLNSCKGNILIEGAQGCDLDINYGLDYPHTTSRMTSASQILSDAGIPMSKVKDIIMIIRPYPIRISNSTGIGQIYSGDYAGSKEISWDEVKSRCGANVDLTEYTTVTKKVRRVFEMNWDRLKYNVMINNPTGIVLNFAQYLDYKSYECNKYEELSDAIKEFIKKIEKETHVPVIMIGTGKRNKDMIDLRKKYDD